MRMCQNKKWITRHAIMQKMAPYAHICVWVWVWCLSIKWIRLMLVFVRNFILQICSTSFFYSFVYVHCTMAMLLHNYIHLWYQNVYHQIVWNAFIVFTTIRRFCLIFYAYIAIRQAYITHKIILYGAGQNFIWNVCVSIM